MAYASARCGRQQQQQHRAWGMGLLLPAACCCSRARTRQPFNSAAAPTWGAQPIARVAGPGMVPKRCCCCTWGLHPGVGLWLATNTSNQLARVLCWAVHCTLPSWPTMPFFSPHPHPHPTPSACLTLHVLGLPCTLRAVALDLDLYLVYDVTLALGLASGPAAALQAHGHGGSGGQAAGTEAVQRPYSGHTAP